MGATSVTGVGPGDVSGLNKGSQHMTLGVNQLIGPHVVSAGLADMNGSTTLTVEHPDLGGTSTDWGIFLQNNGTTHPYVSVHTATDAFEITAGASDLVYWMVVQNGV